MSENPEDFKKQLDLNDLITLNQAAEFSELSVSHLRLLVTRGEIWGRKIGRNWVTTIQAVDEYQKQGHKPGPKSEKKK